MQIALGDADVLIICQKFRAVSNASSYFCRFILKQLEISAVVIAMLNALFNFVEAAVGRTQLAFVSLFYVEVRVLISERAVLYTDPVAVKVVRAVFYTVLELLDSL